MRLFERALRRAGLAMAMSEGYNPRPRFSLPAALSVGITGKNEVLDVELSVWVRPSEIQSRLSEQMPEGLSVRSVTVTPTRACRVPRELSYRIPLLEGHSVTEAKLRQVLERSEISVSRHRKGKRKVVNIRPLIKALRLRDGELHVLVDCIGGAAAHPEEVLQALGCRPGAEYLRGAIERTDVNLSSCS